MYRKNIAYVGFRKICSSRHPLGVLEYIPYGDEGLTIRYLAHSGMLQRFFSFLISLTSAAITPHLSSLPFHGA
jgi:hypothetical protein